MTYHAVTVTFENVGGVVVQRDKSGARTSFNVTVSGKRQYAVQMRGEPRLENGMVVTAVLRDTNNWQTLAGWLNHTTGEICGVDSPVKSFWSFVIVLLISLVFSLGWLDEALSGKRGATGTFVCILAVLVINAWSLFSWRKSVTVYRLLKP
ncbi:hypothetical protein P0D69_24220 [Paraburkholderia sediminicola]|uniref:hypothetical protein n=1 Tax=Paraburkholderia sediminicola TaxID=458836 RepID=UPI0038BA40C0